MAEKLTRESLREWATSKVAEIPTVVLSSIEEKEVPNSVERVLRAVMLRHHNLALSEYTKPELIEDLLRCLMNGIEKPRRDMTVDELLDAILGENFERYGFETVADIDEWCDLEGLESDWMFRHIMT